MSRLSQSRFGRSRFGASRFSGAVLGEPAPVIITGTAPVLAALEDGDTLSTAVTWGSYASSAGTIVDPTTQEMSVNGAAYVAYDGATVVAADDTYQLRETVTDSAANERVFSSAVVTVEAVVGPSADFIITNDAEWDTVFGNTTATLDGSIIEVQGTGYTRRTITNHDFTTGITIRTASGAALQSVQLNATVSKIAFECAFQMTGWPAVNSEMVRFETGTFDQINFDGSSFRHGYGASLVDFDQAATYPEYTRVDNVQTATTSSANYALSWQDAAMTQGWIEFFNRGAVTVYVAVGGPGVTASASDTEVLAGARARITPLDPTADTHFAVIAASGTSEVNARTEIGMSSYLASCFSASGAAVMGDVRVIGCTIRDVNNGIKGLGNTSNIVVMDNDFDRIYQDLVTVSPTVGGAAYVMRNLFSVPFSRSGIAENLNGDARDPHGDLIQGFNNNSGTIGPIYSAGNRTRRSARRTGVTHQGIFISDNDFSPSYDGIYSVSDMLLGGSGNGINSGEPSFPVASVLVWGATVLNPDDLAGGNSGVRFNTANTNAVHVGRTIAQNYVEEGDGFIREDTVQLNETVSAAAVFPSIGDLPVATTRAQIETALTSAAEGIGLGAEATANAVNWVTTDHTSVILWENVGSGVAWEDLAGQAIDTLITLPLRKVLNRRASQAVVPGVGVEWRSVASDGTTEVQAWTTASGTVEPDQFVQIRKQSSASGLTSVDFSVTINGFTQTTAVETQAAAPAVFHTQSGTGPYFRDPANSVPANTTRMEWSANIYMTSSPAATVRLFAQESAGCDLLMLSNGLWQAVAEDGTGAQVIGPTDLTSPIPSLNNWHTVDYIVDHTLGEASLTVDGTLLWSKSWTPTANPFFQTTREISFFGTSAGGNPLPSGWQIEFAECYFTTSGVRSLRKRVEGNAATVNADPWKLGGDAT